MKTIIHYLDGSTYTFSADYMVDCCPEWERGILMLAKGGEKEAKEVYLSPDTLAIESRSSQEGTYFYWTNPAYEVSFLPDIMTARSRSKKNRSNILSVMGQSMEDLKTKVKFWC